MKNIDLKGLSFGSLTVLERVFVSNRTVWRCSCECGNIKTVSTSNLSSGRTKSCGKCEYRPKRKGRMAGGRKVIDMIGLKFGLLTVIEFSGIYEKVACWRCVCECGKEKEIRGSYLRNGDVLSCGCLRYESLIAYKVKQYFSNFYRATTEYKVIKNPETGIWLPYDIYLPNEKIFIEIHGEQHYKNKGYFYKNDREFQHRIYLDKIKKNYAIENGYFIEVNCCQIKNETDAVVYIEEAINQIMSS